MSKEQPAVWVWVDVSANCNLECKLCYTTPMRTRSFMDPAVFDAIVANLLHSNVRVCKFHLNWRGEPAANPGLAKLLKRVSDTGWDTEWHTNGTLISARRAAALVSANHQQRIVLSLDGGNREAFERNRGPGNWDKALRGAENLLAARASAPGLYLGVYQLELGVPRTDYDPRYLRILDRIDGYSLERPVDLDGGLYGTEGTPHEVAVPFGPCFWLGNVLAVDVNGSAWTCLLRNGTKLGSMLTEPADDLTRKAGQLRERVAAKSRQALAGCSRCRKKEGVARLPTVAESR